MNSRATATAMGKTAHVAQLVSARARAAAPGQWLASVQSLQDDAEASIATVVRGVQHAIADGAPIETRRGNEGGYFRSAAAAGTAAGDVRTADEVVLAHARSARAELDELIAAVEQRLAA